LAANPIAAPASAAPTSAPLLSLHENALSSRERLVVRSPFVRFVVVRLELRPLVRVAMSILLFWGSPHQRR
jgi:hypothetical protein